MSNFIFTFPANTPPMTFEALAARLRAVCDLPNCISCPAQIGTTVTLRWHTSDKSAIMVRLYQTTIAILTADDTVRFPNDDPHMATREWVGKIIRDNGLGNNAWRIPRRKADGPGPEVARGRAGLLCVDGDRDKPVHGRTWAVNREQMARDQDFRERWAAEMAFRRLHPEQWRADLAAAKPHQGTPDYRDRVDPALWRGSAHEPDLADIR